MRGAGFRELLLSASTSILLYLIGNYTLFCKSAPRPLRPVPHPLRALALPPSCAQCTHIGCSIGFYSGNVQVGDEGLPSGCLAFPKCVNSRRGLWVIPRLCHNPVMVIEGAIMASPPAPFPLCCRLPPLQELLEDVLVLKPEIFPSVPRMWNRVYDRVSQGGMGEGRGGLHPLPC